MALNEAQISAIEASIAGLHAAGDPLISGLRRQFPDIVFVRCDAQDMDSAPYRSSEHYKLYLFDRSEICIRLTDQLDAADGVIVAEMD
jgi:hypothetical protein